MIVKPRAIKSVVIFGGGGLVGCQVARQIAEHIEPDNIVICALTEQEAKPVVEKLKKEFPNIKNITIEFGNLFVRESLSSKNRAEIISKDENLDTIFNDVFGNITDEDENVGQQNLMVKIIAKHKPDVVIDCVNTATGISYQDVKTCSQATKHFRDNFGSLVNETLSDQDIENAQSGDKASVEKLVSYVKNINNLSSMHLEGFANIDNLKMIEILLISQAAPQLIRHVVLLYKALLAANTFMYIKVGTTGTGGMGMNIPYTHSEDKPSFTLMAKTAVAFAHTGLLFLLSRTPHSPIIKEIKPGAMIGYRKINFRSISKPKRPVRKWESKKETLEKKLNLREDFESYQDHGDLELVVIDTGENGFFTRGEYEAITHPGSMEFVTPEEIARNVLIEMIGGNSGKDVINAVTGSVMSPSYLSGVIRQESIEQMLEMEKEKNIPSIALGELGPPQLSKLLYEAHLLQQKYSSIADIAEDKISSEELAEHIEKQILEDLDLQRIITSLGLPILLKDGKTILRGPKINIPESKIFAEIDIGSENNIDSWAKQGWVDLRPSNMKIWQKRAREMISSQSNEHTEGSACYCHKSYTGDDIRTGEVIGWILANEFDGYRIK